MRHLEKPHLCGIQSACPCCGRQSACPCCRRASLQRQARRQLLSRRLPAPARSDLSKLGRVLGHGRRARTLSVQSRLCNAASPAAPASSLETSCRPYWHVQELPRPLAVEIRRWVCPWCALGLAFGQTFCLRNTGKQPRDKQEDGRPCSKLLPKKGRFVSDHQRQLSSCALLLLGLRPSGGTLPRLVLAPQWLGTPEPLAYVQLRLDDVISRQFQACQLRA